MTPLGPGFLLSRDAIDGTWTSCAVCLAAAFVVALGYWASVRWMEDRIARRRKAR